MVIRSLSIWAIFLLPTFQQVPGASQPLIQAKALPSEADFKKGKERLASDPMDPDSNSVVGKYLAFVSGDYPAAMPFLANCADKTLKALADHELDTTYTDTHLKKIGMGDEWVKATKSFPTLGRPLYERASQWYGMAWPALDPVWKEKTRTQLRKILQNPVIADPKNLVVPSGWKASDNAQKGAPTSKASRSGKNSYQVMGGKAAVVPMVAPIEQTVPATPGKEAEVSAWVLSDGTESAEDAISLGCWGQGGKLLDAKYLYFRPDEPWWQRLYVTFIVPKDTMLIKVRFDLDSKGGTVFFDDVSLKVDGKELLKNGSFEDK